MKKQIVVVGVLAVLLAPNSCLPVIAAPLCKDIPSCGVTGIIVGTQVVAGVLYYLVKNAVGVVHKVRAKQQLPAHRTNEPGRHRVGETVKVEAYGAESCQARARRYGRETDGGEWEVVDIKQVGVAGAPERGDGTDGIYFICTIRKVR